MVGFQPIVDAIRASGAKQMLIASAALPSANLSVRIDDPSVMYTIHGS